MPRRFEERRVAQEISTRASPTVVELPPVRSRTPPRRLRRAVFIDRDGTINPDLRYLADAERLEVFQGVGESIRLLRAHGYAVVCVTNQSGIERGLYTVGDVERIHRRLQEILARDGTQVDAFYYCPHAPERGCRCRKPGTELFERAAVDLHLRLPWCAMIGDRGLDAEAGRRLGMRTVLVPPPGLEAELRRALRTPEEQPDHIAISMRAAVAYLLSPG